MNVQSSKGVEKYLPTIKVDIVTTSGVIASGANSDTIIANNVGGDVGVSLSINSPYTLSSSSLTFAPAVGGTIETKSVNILHDGKVVGTKSIQVTWQ